MKKPIKVLATANKNKIKKYKKSLKNFPIISKTLNDFEPIKEIKEDQLNIFDNTYKKAIKTTKTLKLPIIALVFEDSNLIRHMTFNEI